MHWGHAHSHSRAADTFHCQLSKRRPSNGFPPIRGPAAGRPCSQNASTSRTAPPSSSPYSNLYSYRCARLHDLHGLHRVVVTFACCAGVCKMQIVHTQTSRRSTSASLSSRYSFSQVPASGSFSASASLPPAEPDPAIGCCKCKAGSMPSAFHSQQSARTLAHDSCRWRGCLVTVSTWLRRPCPKACCPY